VAAIVGIVEVDADAASSGIVEARSVDLVAGLGRFGRTADPS